MANALLDFLAELTQHIPNKGEHLVRYYGAYSNKTRGTRAARHSRAKGAPDPSTPSLPAQTPQAARRNWAALIKRVYQADPLLCPRCGATMKIIGFIEACQPTVIEAILRHGGLWQDTPSRAPPLLPAAPQVIETTIEIGPDFIERDLLGQMELAFDA